MISFLVGYALGVATAPLATPIVKTIAKEVVKGGLIVGDAAMAATKSTREGWAEVVHNARAEHNAKVKHHKPRTA